MSIPSFPDELVDVVAQALADADQDAPPFAWVDLADTRINAQYRRDALYALTAILDAGWVQQRPTPDTAEQQAADLAAYKADIERLMPGVVAQIDARNEPRSK